MSHLCALAHAPGSFCYDQASTTEREAFDFLHHHAYAWAEVGGRAQAEEYAAYFAGRHFDDPDGAPAHSDEFERWRTKR